MDEARARRLQPHYVELFFRDVFKRLGGRMARREKGRYEIANVPAVVRQRQRLGAAPPIATRYERVTFDPEHVEVDDARRAELLAPGHPLLDTVLDATVEAHRSALEAGTLLFDPTDPGTEPRLPGRAGPARSSTAPARWCRSVSGIRHPHPHPTVRPSGPGPVPGPAASTRRCSSVRRPRIPSGGWLTAGVEQLAASWAIAHAQPEHLQQVGAAAPADRQDPHGRHPAPQQQINYLYSEATRLRDTPGTGKQGRHRKQRQSPDLARSPSSRPRGEARSPHRPPGRGGVGSEPAAVIGAALVIPAGLLPGEIASHARETARAERRAGRQGPRSQTSPRARASGDAAQQPRL